MIDQKMERYFADWAKREEVAESMVPLIGKLYRDYGVVTTIYGRSLVHNSTIDILRSRLKTPFFYLIRLSIRWIMAI